MKKKSIRMFIAVATVGTMFGIGGCNFTRIFGSLVDHTVFGLVEPFISELFTSPPG